MSVLNVEISCFRNYQTATDPAPVNLLAWLRSPKYRDQVAAIRRLKSAEERKPLKSKLPAVTPSGLFTHRAEAGLVRHSGLICLDIDRKGNEHIGNFESLVFELRQVQNIAYIGQSVSGDGWFCLVPIAEPSRHRQHFEALQTVFWSRWQIRLDGACKDVSRLRGYSFDPDAHFNHTATPHQLQKTVAPLGLSKPAPTDWQPATRPAENDREKVERFLAEIEARRLDLTEGYQNWFEIGCSLAAGFGESGRAFFHTASQFHPKYKPAETDQKFDKCLQTDRITLATFFHHCKMAGLHFGQASGAATAAPTKRPTAEAVAINAHGYPAIWG